MKYTVEMVWSVVNKENLIDLLLGETKDTGQLWKTSFPEKDLRSGKVAVGASALLRGDSENDVLLVIISDDFINDFFSWIRVYSDDIFPLSQFARILTLSEYSILFKKGRGLFDSIESTINWACISVGETLAQSENSIDLKSMALSRILSTYTLPIARSNINHAGFDFFKLCQDRLRKISSDNRFPRRLVNLEQLSPIWEIVLQEGSNNLSASDAVYLMLNYASKYNSGTNPLNNNLSELLAQVTALGSDSVEERVMGFNQLSSEMLGLKSESDINYFAPIIAAAAFLVGRSTSHLFLLNKIGNVAPMIFVWFGLIAAFSGPKLWDITWLRAIKGAEKLLKNKFELEVVSQADINWLEFSWVLEAFKSAEILNELPKMLPKTLSVEIIPGSTLHLRLPGNNSEQDTKNKNEASMRERALEDALSQLFNLSNKLQDQVMYYNKQKERKEDTALFSKKYSNSSSTRSKKNNKW